MCGRYAASASTDELVEQLEVDLDLTGEPTRSVLASAQTPPAGTPDYNMAPTKQAPVVLARAPRGESAPDGRPGTRPADETEAVRQLRLLTWGLVPSWSRDPKGGARMINARRESVLDKPAFVKAAAARRCLVPALGWYEWQRSPTAVTDRGAPRTQPFFTRRADGELLAFAGLYEFWRDRAVADRDDPDAWLVTFTIITTQAEPGLDRIHDRQPVVLERGDWAEWLDPGLTDLTAVGALLAPHEPGRFTAYPVGKAVSSSRAQGAGLIEPADLADLDGVVDPTSGEIIGGAR